MLKQRSYNKVASSTSKLNLNNDNLDFKPIPIGEDIYEWKQYIFHIENVSYSDQWYYVT